MTERENFFKVYNREKPSWIPCFYSAYQPFGSSLLNNQGARGIGGFDMFGVKWLITPDTGEAIADPEYHVLDDITRWREVIEFPDLDAMDWEKAAEQDIGWVNREAKVLAAFGMEGNLNRLQSLLGVCEALMALLDEPEAVYDFFKAHTEFKMKTIEKYAQYYKPDIYVNGDDVCSSTGLMFSRQIYDDLFKPFEMMLGQKAKDCGLIVEHHVCGKCDDIIPDIIETGATIWQTAQSMNDLVGIQKRYGDQLVIHGGWDSYGPWNFPDTTEEQIRSEVRRCIDEYAPGGSYMLFAIMMGPSDDPNTIHRRKVVTDECRSYSEAWLKNKA